MSAPASTNLCSRGGWREGCRRVWRVRCPDEREVRLRSGRDRRDRPGAYNAILCERLRAEGTRTRGERLRPPEPLQSERTICVV